MKTRRPLPLFLSLVLAAAWIPQAAGQDQAAPTLPRTSAGRNVAAYLEAFNAGEAAIKDFFLTRTAAGSLKQMPIEARLDRYRQMRERLGTLELRKVVDAAAGRIGALVQGSNGPLVRMDFEFEAAEPFGLLGIRVMDAGGEGAAAPPADPKRDDAELVAAVGAYLRGLADRDEFSGVVLLAVDGQPFFQAAYGMADRERKIPNRVDTKFNIGSINKSFTATAVRLLEAAGRLTLDDPIGKFLTDYPNRDAAARVTVRHLLDMTSGIGDFFNERYEQADKLKIKSLADYLPLFADRPLEFEPGSRRQYSNGGYVVLGLVIEKAAGTDYYSFVRERIFKPAGMTDSGSFAKDEDVPNRALGYVKEGAARKPNYATLPGRGSSAGGGYSTAGDLMRYVAALREGKWGPAPAETLSQPRSRSAGAFGAGETGGGFGIAGGAPGLNAAVEWEPRGAYTIVVLSNFGPPSAESVAARIRSWLPRG